MKEARSPGNRREAFEERAQVEAMSSEHYVYMVQCRDGTLYTGYTTNVSRRIAAHNAGKGGHYTRAHRPVTLVAAWAYTTKGEALRIERQIKGLSRAQKLRLIDGEVTEAR